MPNLATLIVVLGLISAAPALGAEPTKPLKDEDGSKLWLRFAVGPRSDEYREAITHVVVEGNSSTASIVRKELVAGLSSMLEAEVVAHESAIREGAVVVGTPKNSSTIRGLSLQDELRRNGPEGYIIRSMPINGRPAIVVASEGEIGILYGAFRLLRHLQTAKPIDGLAISEKPRLHHRVLNHWDNLDGYIERGYAGASLWRWSDLPDVLDSRYVEYARANASLGINGAVLNNVNANAQILTRPYIVKVKALADVFRPYGIRVYLSARFSAPIEIGGLPTADPLDPSVAAWWKEKADEIYALIPDFGGFLIKANSEGQPGPKDYNRTHAQGAQVLADALKPHDGIVMWRAFVYDAAVDPDRANRSYLEFTRLDGEFRQNAIVQVKNGVIDFQPREPFHPLFGGLERTSVFAELQPSQEYLGQARHLVYLGTQWEEFLDSDTHAQGEGSTVGKYLAGEVVPMGVTGMAGVVNPGRDTNWCGHHFSQANWYAFGCLAWDHELTAEEIADDWVRQTFTNDDTAVETIREMMMASHEIYVGYTMPLGLHHLTGGGDHYSPKLELPPGAPASWAPTNYHKADSDGIGYDRTATGSKHTAQYHPPVRERFESTQTCPEKHLLWFHHVPWGHRMKSGRTLWEELCTKYSDGARGAKWLQAKWDSVSGSVDSRRHREVAERLKTQVKHAAEWRDKALHYFQGHSGRPIYSPTEEGSFGRSTDR